MAEAIGTPLLGGLTGLAKGLKAPAELVRQAASSDFVQKAIQIGGGAGVALLAGKLIAGPLAAIGLGRQLGTSSVTRSWFAGRAGQDTGTFAARFGAPSNELFEREGVRGRGLAAGPAARAYEAGVRSRQATEERLRRRMGDQAYEQYQERRQERMLAGQQPGDPRAGPSPLRRAFRNVVSYGGVLAETYGNVLNQQYGDPARPIGERGSRTASPFNFPARATMAGEEARLAWRNQGGIGGGFTSLSAGMREFHRSLTQNTTATQSATGAVRAHARALGAMGTLAATSAAGGIRGAAVAGRAIGGRLVSSGLAQAGGGVGLGVAAGVGLLEMRSVWEANREEAKKAWESRDMNEAMNAYKESIGKATGPIQTMGSAADELTKTLTKTTKTFEEASKVRPEDIAAKGTGTPTRQYVGTPEQIAAQITQNAGMGGMAPDEIQAIKMDLLKSGRSEAEVNQILGNLGAGAKTPTTAQRPGQPVTQGPLPGIAQAIAGVANEGAGGGSQGGLVGFWEQFLSHPLPGVTDWSQAGTKYYPTSLTDASQKAIQDQAGALVNRSVQQTEVYGGEYAEQEKRKGAQLMVEEAIKTGEPAVLNEVTLELTKIFGGAGKELSITKNEIDAANGDFLTAYAKRNEDFGKVNDEFLKKQREQTGGQFGAEVQSGYYSKLLKDVAPTFASAFDKSAWTPISQAFEQSRMNENDAGKLTNAADSFVKYSQDAGKSLSELQIEAHKASGELDQASIAFRQVQASAQSAQRAQARAAINQTPVETQAEQFKAQLGIARSPRSSNEAVEAQRVGAEEGITAQLDQDKQRMIARLQMQRQFEIQTRRQNEDYERGRSRTLQDYETQRTRVIRNYGIQRERMIYDYNKQVERANEDYHTSVERANRDFNIGLLRAEQDYQRQRARQIRDFNISLARQIEDAAKTMYDPYTRIQTKATWDAKNLLVNMKEQNDALAKQKSQLDELRRMGVSAQTIDVLQLGKSENAQQVNNLFQDLGQSPELAGQLNEMAKNRAGLTGAMFLDESNIELKRSREDLQKTLDDQATDYRISIDRSREDLRKSLDDQAFDFKRTMTRTADDFRMTLQRNEADLATTLRDMAFDLNRSLNRMHEDFTRQTNRMVEDLREADLMIAGNFKTILEQTMKAMNGQAVQWTAITVNSTNDLLNHLNKNVVPAVFDAAGKLNITMPGMTGPIPLNAKGESASVASGIRHAEGGIIAGVSPHKKADDKLALLTSGEYVQPVDTVNYYGENIMDKVRLRAIPRGAFDGFAEGGLVRFADGGRASKDGQAVDTKTYAIITAAEKMLGWAIRVTQGSWSTRVAASGGTHAGAGASDSVPSGPYPPTVAALRSKGGIAWWRTPSQGPWINHIHMAVPQPGMSAGLASQVAQYARGGDGLGGRDPGPPVDFAGLGNVDLSQYAGAGGGGYAAPPPRPKPDYDKMFAGFDNARTGSMYPLLRDMFKTKIRESFEKKLDEKYAAETEARSGRGGINAGPVGGNTELERFILAIVKQETGGEPDPYKSRWGKYAMSPQYINGYALKYLGRPMSAQEYLSSPANQDELGRAALTGLFNQYGAKGAASSWYSGNPTLYNSTKPQPGGPSIKAYVDSVLRYMGYDKGGLLQPGQTMTENTTGKPEAVLTDEQWSSISKLAELAGSMITAEQGRQLTAAGGVHLTIDRRTINNDHRTDLTGAEITVVAQDPEELGQKLRQKEWASRATATRGVNRGH